MKNITRYALEKPVITFSLLALLAFMGMRAYVMLPRSEDPGFIIREARVYTFFPGASPTRVEDLVTDKIEETLQEIPEVDYLKSESRTGLSSITVKVQNRYTDMQPIWDKVRRKTEKAARSLPQGVIGPIVNDEFGDVFGTVITLTGDGQNYQELKSMASAARKRFLAIPDVAKVEIYGDQEERIFVEFNIAKLAELGTSSKSVGNVLSTRNTLTSGGTLYTSTEQIILEPTGNYDSLKEIAETIIPLPNQKGLVYLKDLATVRRGYIDPPNNIVHRGKTSGLAIAISLREEGNVIKLGEDVEKLVRNLQAEAPLGTEYQITLFQSDIVSKKVDNFVINLLQSVTIVMLSMFFFLGFRTGIIVTVLIPMTILATFFAMQCLNIGIDQISLASLIIALGMLVDNAIVITESIMTEINGGKDLKQAAIDSADELRISLLTSSLTTSAAFLPIILAHSLAGEYTSSIFKVVTITLLGSWVLSLTMTPLLCYHFLKNTRDRINFEKLSEKYRCVLFTILKKPKRTLTIFTLLFFVALGSFSIIPKTFFPPSDRPLFTIQLDLPVGTKIVHTQKVVEQFETFLETLKPHGLTSWTAFIGGQAPRYVINYVPQAAAPEKTFFLVNTKSAENISELMVTIHRYAEEYFPELRVSMRPTETGPPVAFPIEVRLTSHDQNKLIDTAAALKRQLLEEGATINVHDDWGGNSKKIIIDINQARALRAGITSTDVAISLQTLYSGFETTQFRDKDTIIPITLRSSAVDRGNIDKLAALNVYSQETGASVPLTQVADLNVIWQPNAIHRRDRMQTITVQADLKAGVTPFDVVDSISAWLKGQDLKYEIGGTVESSSDSQKSIYAQVPLAALAIILLLIVQFNSLLRPLIICSTIPLGIIGVAAGLLATGYPMGFMSFLGMISLSGIVINNGIVLLDRIQFEIDSGATAPDAVLGACKRRLRPIVLTTLTTVGGLMPLWFGGGALFQPMAVAIIFGLIFSTVLTLGFVPLLYSFFFNVKFDQSDL